MIAQEFNTDNVLVIHKLFSHIQEELKAAELKDW